MDEKETNRKKSAASEDAADEMIVDAAQSATKARSVMEWVALRIRGTNDFDRI